MAKTTKGRPAVFEADTINLDNLMVGQPKGKNIAAEVEMTASNAAPAKGEAAMFRTSIYFSRAVHDKLRAIAFEERKSVAELVNEGLDHVLEKRNYPTTAELKASQHKRA